MLYEKAAHLLADIHKKQYQIVPTQRDEVTFAISATLPKGERQKLKLLNWKLKEEKRNLASVLEQAANMIPLFLSKTTGDLWQQALDECLASETHVIKGREITYAKARGYNIWEDLLFTWHYFLVEKLKFPADTAELLVAYLHQLKYDHRISFSDWFERLENMNEMLPLVPALIDVQGSDQTERMNVKLTDEDLLGIAQRAMPPSIMAALRAKMGEGYWPETFQDFRDHCKEIEDKPGGKHNVSDHEDLIRVSNQLNSNASQKYKSQRAVALASEDTTEGGGPCVRCLLLKPSIAKTHFTEECTRWTDKQYQRALEVGKDVFFQEKNRKKNSKPKVNGSGNPMTGKHRKRGRLNSDRVSESKRFRTNSSQRGG